jgi:hypothetical protein
MADSEADLVSRPVSPTQALQTLVAPLPFSVPVHGRLMTCSTGLPIASCRIQGCCRRRCHRSRRLVSRRSFGSEFGGERGSLSAVHLGCCQYARRTNGLSADRGSTMAGQYRRGWAVRTSSDFGACVCDMVAPIYMICFIQSSLGKRQREEAEEKDEQSKTRRLETVPAPGQMYQMTTVVCLHAAVAQKSYSTEKRFLCPPPIVHVEGNAAWHMRNQHLAMSVVVTETGERSFDQKAMLDSNMEANFKFLHVAGTGKAKTFHLSLDISEPPPGASTFEEQGTSSRIWASFDSASVSIISKPSKKTAKTRNVSSCILAGAPVSLFNRINSQTVRTKYMTIDNAQLCASNTKWAAFTVNLARRAHDLQPISRSRPLLLDHI